MRGSESSRCCGQLDASHERVELLLESGDERGIEFIRRLRGRDGILLHTDDDDCDLSLLLSMRLLLSVRPSWFAS